MSVTLYKYSKYITVEDIVTGSSHLFTNLFSFSAEGYNSILRDMLITNADKLILDYAMNRLEKTLSPLYQRLIDYYLETEDEDNALNDSAEKICNIIQNKFLEKWNRLANALFSDYNPISNYDMTEEETTSGSSDKTGTSKVELQTIENTNTETINSYQGFNSAEYKGVSRGNSDTDRSSTTTGSSANNGTTEETSSEGSRTLTRSGNIGVTTSQQMIESEIELRKKQLIDIIYRDMDSVAFIDYYC